MDGGRFDALARGLGSLVDRRTTARALAGGGLAGVGLAASHDAEAKKKNKKKCKKPKVKCGKKCCAAGSVCFSGACAPGCQFVKSNGDTLWTLQADCASNSVIEIPDGVTLDGNGKTIRLGFAGDNLRTTGASATVRNLTLDGGLRCVSGLVFNRTSGQVQDVSIFDLGCGDAGITIIGTDGASVVQVDVDNATVSRLPGAGISYFSRATGTVSNSTVRNADIGVNVNTSDVTVDGNVLEDVTAGVRVLASVGAATANVMNNTIVGRGPIPAPTRGVDFLLSGAGGSVAGNTISNFFDSRTGTGDVGCGILLDVGATAVTIGTNTFPDPPGNEQNVCDNRP